MKITNSQLLNLPVITESGHELGRLEAYFLESESQSILEYKVKPTSLVKEIISGDLIISRGQVIDIRKDKIIVEDNISSIDLPLNVKKAFKTKKSVALNKE